MLIQVFFVFIKRELKNKNFINSAQKMRLKFIKLAKFTIVWKNMLKNAKEMCKIGL